MVEDVNLHDHITTTHGSKYSIFYIKKHFCYIVIFFSFFLFSTGNYGTNQGLSFIPSSLEEELCGFCEALAVEKGHCKHHCNLYCSGGRK